MDKDCFRETRRAGFGSKRTAADHSVSKNEDVLLLEHLTTPTALKRILHITQTTIHTAFQNTALPHSAFCHLRAGIIKAIFTKSCVPLIESFYPAVLFHTSKHYESNSYE